MTSDALKRELLELFPIAPAGHWTEDALCVEVGPGPFFPPVGSSVEPAKRICARCPVTVACREYALEEFIREGVWGGTSREDRKRIWKERRVVLPVEEVA